MKFETIKAECEEAGHLRRDGHCAYNHYLKCNGYQCVVLHWFRNTRPTNVLANLGLEKEYEEEMNA